MNGAKANCKRVAAVKLPRSGDADRRQQQQPRCPAPGSSVPPDLSPTMKPPMAKAGEFEHHGEYDLDPAERDILGLGNTFKLRSRESSQGQAGGQVAARPSRPRRCRSTSSPRFQSLHPPVGDAGRRGDLLGCGDGAGPGDTRAPGVGPDRKVAGKVQSSRRMSPALHVNRP